MKYSVMGKLNGILADSPEQQEVLDTINNINPIFRLVQSISQETNKNNTKIYVMNFEVWLDSVEDKDFCFGDLKKLVDKYTGIIHWHVCTNDEQFPRPCVISEKYFK